MNLKIRAALDKGFSLFASCAVIVLVLLLVGILGPIIIKGSSAVFFNGTVEFRKMQRALFDRASDDLNDEIQKAQAVRKPLYDMLDSFKVKNQGANTAKLESEIKNSYRQLGRELKAKGIQGQEYSGARKLARKIRNALEDALESQDKQQIYKDIEFVLSYRNDPLFKDTSLENLFIIAQDYVEIVKEIDLSKKDFYAAQLEEIDFWLIKLLGPKPNQDLPDLAENQFGATRMDMAQKAHDKILWQTQWKAVEGQRSVKVEIERKEIFAGTELEKFFVYLEDNYEAMLLPKKTVYWQYFIDDSTPGHYFGGVGPEIIGTLAITVISMLFAIPLGVISAAYLVECAGDNIIIRLIRMCINTLAGVPSIVFGLFGLAFFVLFLMPLLGHDSEKCILAAALTLSILTLPVMIRASEEAIKAVPRTYKEASLGLGASRLKTFLKVILPSALPGILTGIILSLSRVAGETAPVLFTGAVALGSIPEFSLKNLNWLFQPTRCLSYGSYDMAVGDRIAMQVPHNQFGMVVTLILLILILNAASIWLRTKIAKKLRGH